MFWTSNISVLFITPSEIRTAVLTSHGRMTKDQKVYPWNEDSLPSVLGEIASRGPSRARVIFCDDFSYVASLDSDGKTRNGILEKAKENIPDELDDNWDFKQCGVLEFLSQIAAIKSSYFKKFIIAFNEAGLNVEAIEPQSISIARLLPQAGFFLFIAKYDNVLLGAVKNGVVIATYVAKNKDVISVLNKFLPYVKNKFKDTPERVFVDKEINPNSEVFVENGLKAETENLDPLLGMALKRDISGEDARILNIDPRKTNTTFEKKINKKKEITLREKILLSLFSISIIIAVLLVFLKIR